MSASSQPTLGTLLGSWSFDPGLSGALLLTALMYGFGAWRTRDTWRALRALSFMCGLVVLAVALLSGVDSYGERLLSVHVVQHLLLALVVPVLLLWGAPVRLALAAGSGSRHVASTLLARRAVHLLGRPAVGLVLFAGVVLGSQLTGLYELALRHPGVHELEHLAFLTSGLVLLAPLIGADPVAHPPGAVARFSWLMGAMAVMSLPGALLSFSTSVWYPYYLAPAHALGRSALADQQLGGAIMWVGGGVLMFALALVLTMQAMLAEERRQRRRELHEDRKHAETAAVLGA